MAKYKRKKGGKLVKTRKSYPFKGVKYKSALERNMAMLLDEAGIPFKYESITYDLVEGFTFPFDCYERQANEKGEFKQRGGKKIRSISYTPDFVGKGFIIETKGYTNEAFPMRWKLFKKWLTDNLEEDELILYKPQNTPECEQVIELIKSRQNERSGDIQEGKN